MFTLRSHVQEKIAFQWPNDAWYRYFAGITARRLQFIIMRIQQSLFQYIIIKGAQHDGPALKCAQNKQFVTYFESLSIYPLTISSAYFNRMNGHCVCDVSKLGCIWSGFGFSWKLKWIQITIFATVNFANITSYNCY